MLPFAPTYTSQSAIVGSGSRFSPSDLSLLAWYDPSDLSTLWQDTAGTTPVTTDGQSVLRMDDKSGNGFHATQATGSKAPLYKTSGGLHWLEFDGVDDALGHTINATCASMMAVRRTGAGDAYDGLLLITAGHRVYLRLSTDKWGTFSGSDQPADTTLATNTNYVLTSEAKTALDYYINGVADGSFAGMDAPAANAIGAVNSGGTAASPCRIYGIICSTTDFGADRAAAETWLGTKAGLSI